VSKAEWLSFRGAGAASEPGSHEHCQAKLYDRPVFMVSGPALSGASRNDGDWSVERFGERGLVDLTGLIGYYSFVSVTLNVFEVPVPPGAALLPT